MAAARGAEVSTSDLRLVVAWGLMLVVLGVCLAAAGVGLVSPAALVARFQARQLLVGLVPGPQKHWVVLLHLEGLLTAQGGWLRGLVGSPQGLDWRRGWAGLPCQQHDLQAAIYAHTIMAAVPLAWLLLPPLMLVAAAAARLTAWP